MISELFKILRECNYHLHFESIFKNYVLTMIAKRQVFAIKVKEDKTMFCNF